MEDKKAICEALTPVLRMTRKYQDLVALEFNDYNETVLATFQGGATKKAYVAMDSGATMIKDILRQID